MGKGGTALTALRDHHRTKPDPVPDTVNVHLVRVVHGWCISAGGGLRDCGSGGTLTRTKDMMLKILCTGIRHAINVQCRGTHVVTSPTQCGVNDTSRLDGASDEPVLMA